MTLDVLINDMNAALKNNDKALRQTLSNFVAQIKRAAIDKGCRDNIPEELVNAELLKIKKSIQEQIDTCPILRQDLLDKYSYEMVIIHKYAPIVINDEIIIYDRIVEIVGSTKINKKQRGMIMKEMKGAAANGVYYDMAAVNKVLGGMMEG